MTHGSKLVDFAFCINDLHAFMFAFNVELDNRGCCKFYCSFRKH